MKRISLAGPMFCAAEKTFNEEVTELLESSGYSVFLPQRDGTEVLTGDMNEEQKALAIFDADRSEIEKADALVMVLDGRVPDEGACVELGIAYALGKPCYGVRTDVRAAERGMDVNPMLTGCFRRIFRSENKGEAFGELKAFIAAHGL
mgnify:FL=1